MSSKTVLTVQINKMTTSGWAISPFPEKVVTRPFGTCPFRIPFLNGTNPLIRVPFGVTIRLPLPQPYKHKKKNTQYLQGAMVFNATFNNISVILWGSVLLVEETGVPGENQSISIFTRSKL